MSKRPLEKFEKENQNFTELTKDQNSYYKGIIIIMIVLILVYILKRFLNI